MEANTPLKYEEELPAPLWLQAALLLGVVAPLAAILGSAVDGEDTWSLRAIFYPMMAVVAALLVFSFVSFRRLRIAVSDEELQFAFGILRKSLPLAAIQSCETKTYRWLTYGGWGIRYALGGRRA